MELGPPESPCSPWTLWKPEGPFFILRSMRGGGPPERGGLEAESPSVSLQVCLAPWAQKMSGTSFVWDFPAPSCYRA